MEGATPPPPPGFTLDSGVPKPPPPNPSFPATNAANRAIATTNPRTQAGADMHLGDADIRLKPPAAPKIPVETVPLTPTEQFGRDAWNLPGRVAKSVVKTAQDIYHGLPGEPPAPPRHPFAEQPAPPVTTGPGAVTTPKIAQGQPGITQRAYRNNSPGNLKYRTRNPFPGSAPGEDGFADFDTLENGYGAIIQRAKEEGPNRTLAQYISTYAPPNENNTGEYLRYVASKLGVDPNTRMGDLDTNKLAAAQAFKESQTVISGAPAAESTDPMRGYKKGASESRIGHHLETTPVNVIPELAKLAASATGIPGILGIPDAIKDWASGTPNRGYPPGPIGENPLSQAVGNLSMAGALSSNAPAPSTFRPRNMGEAFGAAPKHEVTIEPWRTGEKPPPSGFLSRLTAPGTGRMWGGATEMAGGIGLAASGHPIAGPSLFIRGVRDFHKGLDTPRTAPTPRPQVREFTTVDRGAPRWSGLGQPDVPPPPAVSGIPSTLPSTRVPGPKYGPEGPPPAPPEPPYTPVWQGMEQPDVPPPPRVEGIPSALPSTRIPGPKYGPDGPPAAPIPSRPAPPWQGSEQPTVTPPPMIESIPSTLPSTRIPGPKYGPGGPPAVPVSSRPAPLWAGMEQPTITPPPKVEGIPGPLPSGNVPGKPPVESVPEVTTAPTPNDSAPPVKAKATKAKATKAKATKMSLDEINAQLLEALREPEPAPAKLRSISKLIKDFKKGPTPEAKGGVHLPPSPHGPRQPHGFPGPKGPKGPKGPSAKVKAYGFPTKNTAKPKRRWYSPPRMPKLRPESEMPRMPR